ncbi:amidohydrolase [Nocardioides mesophilus]|uniref:Amidohydrolase n=1 Tax=Nocardioides mesophilus TaxID=433659 RepID=A0A7G9R983_9ACTN|nr:amidohydrolase [Nocardioides mesophilus]QNN52158.1 amidohydrolase [Nocardioides mesophilus]
MTTVDLLFRNGSLFDGDRHRPGRAVGVRAGRITAVVAEQEADDLVGRGTRVVDLAGGLLLPGFQDAHVHPVQGGLERIRCDLSELGTREEYVAAVADYAARNPGSDWVCGGGWAMPAFGAGGPTAALLDAVLPDRPVFLPNRDHHGAWVNSAAMRAAGIDRGTPDPVDGRLERDADGTPTGTLHEGAMALVQRLVPAPDVADYDRALAEAQAYLHSVGVTAWQDAILGDYAGLDDPAPTYQRAVAAGRLTARVRGALWWDRARGLEQVVDLLERRERFTGGRLVAGSVKVMQDGVAENYTAAMTRPYRDGCGGHTHNAGLSFVDPELLAEAVTRLDAHGFQVHVHAIGDRAVREALDAVAAARRANGTTDGRHHLAHLQVVHPEDRHRFAELDVTATVQPLWAAYDEQMVELTIPFLDEAAVAWQYPFGDLARAGARLAAGSDWPVSSPDPLAGIHVAVNRRLHGETGRAGSEAFLADQALGAEQAFAAYTSGSARVNHLDETGRVAPGLLADLVVLDRDPLVAPAEEIGAARVRETYVDGEQVFIR